MLGHQGSHVLNKQNLAKITLYQLNRANMYPSRNPSTLFAVYSGGRREKIFASNYAVPSSVPIHPRRYVHSRVSEHRAQGSRTESIPDPGRQTRGESLRRIKPGSLIKYTGLLGSSSALKLTNSPSKFRVREAMPHRGTGLAPDR